MPDSPSEVQAKTVDLLQREPWAKLLAESDASARVRLGSAFLFRLLGIWSDAGLARLPLEVDVNVEPLGTGRSVLRVDLQDPESKSLYVLARVRPAYERRGQQIVEAIRSQLPT